MKGKYMKLGSLRESKFLICAAITILLVALLFLGCKKPPSDLLGEELWYKSSVISNEAMVAIESEVKKLDREHQWWTESINLWPKQTSSTLEGWSKIPPLSWQDSAGKDITVDLNDWYFMLYWDMRFIVEGLTTLSGQHKMTWTLSSEGGEIGTISNGTTDDNVVAFLEGLAKQANTSSNDAANQHRAAEMHRKIPGFWIK
jgi:hypothetical protein